jgi:hypothetical protein
VAVARKLAGVPVMWLRHADGKMRRDSIPAALLQRPCAVDERGRVRGAPGLVAVGARRVQAWRRGPCRRKERKREWLRRERRHDRLRGRDKGIAFQSLNALWFAADAQPLPAYADSMRNTFQAQVKIGDLSRPEAIDEINAWFAQRTQNLIPQMFSAIPRDMNVALANALYFKGQCSRSWTP